MEERVTGITEHGVREEARVIVHGKGRVHAPVRRKYFDLSAFFTPFAKHILVYYNEDTKKILRKTIK
ncbi:hypothetical protein MUN89_03165 [Halobacillus salinarum]|uniref:Uncharacterized protein n=1 Tax=Halobacillus salinarum TaxID=2932257 RepID=A0ABY4ES57_9BACI|nr:hypothetical protein [Halobacillus salinarum]UOQ44966.1 hypothetical protein MUN89_03165 [Halobacillus salinarum]